MLSVASLGIVLDMHLINPRGRRPVGVAPPPALVAAVRRAYHAVTSDVQLAERIGVSRGTLVRIAAGIPVRRASLIAVARALEVDLG